MIRPGNELLTDRHRAAARWLPTTGLDDRHGLSPILYDTAPLFVYTD